MEIKFIEILPRIAIDKLTALFRVNNKEIKISISITLMGNIWDINSLKERELALKQIGRLKILSMVANKEKLLNYTFRTYDFKKDDRTMTFGEVVNKLEKEISESDQKD